MTAFLAYLFFFVAASVSPLQRRWLAVKREGGGQIDFAFRVMGIAAILATIILPLIRPLTISGSPYKLIGLAILAGGAGAVYFSSFFSAQKHVEAGISTLVNNIYTPVTIILAIIFLREGLTLTQVGGTVLLLMSMVLVAKKHRLGRFKFDKWFLLMFLSGIFLGISLTAEKALLNKTGFTAGVLISWWAQVISLGLAAYFFKNRTTYRLKDTLVTGGLKFLHSLSWVILLLVVGNLSVVSAITTFKVVIIFLAAAVFLGEREDLPRKIIGSLLGVAGLLLMK